MNRRIFFHPPPPPSDIHRTLRKKFEKLLIFFWGQSISRLFFRVQGPSFQKKEAQKKGGGQRPTPPPQKNPMYQSLLIGRLSCCVIFISCLFFRAFF